MAIFSDLISRWQTCAVKPNFRVQQAGGNQAAMDKKTKGAWLLAQSKSLDGYSGPGAARLENISHSGKVGRLYNLLRLT